MTRPTAALLAVLLAAPAAARAPETPDAEALAQLVEQRAREVYGPALPLEGELDVTVRGAIPRGIVALSDFWMDLSTGQFLANAVLEDGHIERLKGLARVEVPVPVPTRRLMPGEIVGESDLEVLRLPIGRVGSYAITDVSDILGKQVRRLLAPGRPVMAQSVIEPLVVDRGARVTITFRDGALALSAPGRALGDAHRGEPVRIVNLVSMKSLTAIATAEGQVEIER